MKFQKFLDRLLEEEHIDNTHEFLKNLAKQSYYFLLICFKLKILYNKEACDKTVWRHWFQDEFIGNSLKRSIYYFKGKITKEEIINSCMMNFDNNYKRLCKDVIDCYKTLIDKNDLLEENIRKLAIICYSRLADCIVNNDLKNIDYNKTANYIIDQN